MTLLLFPFKAEFQEFYSQVAKGREVQERLSPIGKTFYFPKEKWICAYGGWGKVEYALRVQALCQQWPEIAQVICAGGAGRLNPQLKIGDLVLGAKTVEYDFQTGLPEKGLPIFHADPEFLKSFQGLKPQETELFVGTVASGDENILTPERAQSLRLLTGADVVAWEGAGGARACRLLKKPFLEIRAITDHCDGSTFQAFTENLPQAMRSLAKLLLLWSQNSFFEKR